MTGAPSVTLRPERLARWAGLRRINGSPLGARNRGARDESPSALGREVTLGPIERDREAVAEADQEIDVSDAPKDPCGEAREAGVNYDDGAALIACR